MKKFFKLMSALILVILICTLSACGLVSNCNSTPTEEAPNRTVLYETYCTRIDKQVERLEKDIQPWLKDYIKYYGEQAKIDMAKQETIEKMEIVYLERFNYLYFTLYNYYNEGVSYKNNVSLIYNKKGSQEMTGKFGDVEYKVLTESLENTFNFDIIERISIKSEDETVSFDIHKYNVKNEEVLFQKKTPTIDIAAVLGSPVVLAIRKGDDIIGVVGFKVRKCVNELFINRTFREAINDEVFNSLLSELMVGTDNEYEIKTNENSVFYKTNVHYEKMDESLEIYSVNVGQSYLLLDFDTTSFAPGYYSDISLIAISDTVKIPFDGLNSVNRGEYENKLYFLFPDRLDEPAYVSVLVKSHEMIEGIIILKIFEPGRVDYCLSATFDFKNRWYDNEEEFRLPDETMGKFVAKYLTENMAA